MEITAQMVKQLRERTGAAMKESKAALNETQGDMESAVDYLRKKGLAAAAKKAGRVAAEGAVGSYIHGGGKIGVLVEVNCETDFVARTEQFQELIRDIAMHIAAAEPRAVRREEVTQADLDRERAIFRDQAVASGKPANIVDKIVDGKMEKYFSEFVLLEQPFVKDPDKTVGQMIAEKIGKVGENIQVRRFVRFKLVEGIEKRQDDFAAEVMAQAGRG
jgi:elongation factor Ts